MSYLLLLSLLLSLPACRLMSGSTQSNEVKNEDELNEEEEEPATLSKSKQDLFKRSQEGLPNDLPAGSATAPADASQEAAEISAKLLAIAADKACSRDASCVVKGLNKLACGMPTRYAIFSKESSRYSEVDPLIARSLELEKAASSTSMQTCGAPLAPVTACVSRKCSAVGQN